MTDSKIQSTIEAALEAGRIVIPYGDVATYIPELAKADKNALGIAVRTKDGTLYSAGDCATRFTLQSISKIISLIVALERFGSDRVFERVGMEPSGEAFNSIVELDLYSGKPYNPMINSGAIAVADLLLETASFGEMLAIARELMGDPEASLDEAVYRSEMANCSRNRAIGWLLKSKNIIKNDVEDILELYTAMCSVNATAVSLANLGLLLSQGGIDRATGKRTFSSETARIVKTLMLTCGMYDGSGQFAVEVGFPTKSGVGGGLLSVVDREMGIGIYGPSLDSKGNCVAGRTMLRYLSSTLGLHIFNS
ncbi:MAG: glutaminase A [Firmicutes bacterium]|nr:glutaminase A [Bacillota bacterium]MBR3052807.1 glutaminase A [Bacillota bacterium]MBR3211892.1 glutaminase A [Bacillota bacterium]